MLVSRRSDVQFNNIDIDLIDRSASNFDILYCSHLCNDSNLRKAIIDTHCLDSKSMDHDCYTCRGKIRKYNVKTMKDNDFLPHTHSTPKNKLTLRDSDIPTEDVRKCRLPEESNTIHSNSRSSLSDIDNVNDNMSQYVIPSISQLIDSNISQKFTSYENDLRDVKRKRLKRSLRGIRCFVSLSLSDSTFKKRTKLQACSVSVMIVAIVIISFVLVNFTTRSFTCASIINSTTVVPIVTIDINESSSMISSTDPYTFEEISTIKSSNTLTAEKDVHSQNSTIISNLLAKLQKNIRTFPREVKSIDRHKTKEISSREVSKAFCLCQTNEVCMLDESTGTSVCKIAVDDEDPTGCGGLCALETEACQLVDKERGVRVCRLLATDNCQPLEWRCRNGLCVTAEARCDGSIQCYDRSDEMNCECDLTKQFRCGHSISCYDNKKLCDGIIDCWDGFDEMNCTIECPEHLFTCTDGQCVHQSMFCDGFSDCADGSDEPFGCDGACSAHEMRCKNNRCIPRNLRCNGRDNCGDATDELNCF